MIFNDTTSAKAGVVQEINDICNSDDNSYPLTSKTRRVNAALDRFFTLAFKADGRWPFDDSNHSTTELIESITINNGNNRYDIDSFASEVISILKVKILDSAGVQHTIERNEEIPKDIPGSGVPTGYNLIGTSLYLGPTPNYQSINGLTLYIHRNKSAFVYTDTTKVLGIPSIFHQYICRLASLPYLIEFQKGQKNDVASMIQSDEQEIVKHFKNRTGITQKMTPFPENNR